MLSEIKEKLKNIEIEFRVKNHDNDDEKDDKLRLNKILELVKHINEFTFEKLNEIQNDVARPQIHFSEYEVTNKTLPTNLIERFNEHLRKHTEEEYAEYAIEQAKEKERIRKQADYDREHPPFLSDEWRWMMIDRRGGY